MTFTLIPKEQNIARQEMTGIKKQFRGKQLGQYLKAQMIIKIKADFPHIQYLVTNCYESNRPIININEKMGYSLEKNVSQYRLSQDALDEFPQ